MTIDEQALAKLIEKNLLTLEPVAKNVAKKTTTKQIPRTDGSVGVQVDQTLGDIFMKQQLALAIAKSVANAIKQHVTFPAPVTGLPTPWFEWDSTQGLAQFDAPLLGPRLTGASGASIVSLSGDDWISLKAVSDATAANGARQSIILPITTLPPVGEGYVVQADFISISRASGSLVGAAVVARMTAQDSLYLVRYNDASAGPGGIQRLDKFTPTFTITQKGQFMADPQNITNNEGVKIGISAEADGILRMIVGEKEVIVDTTSPHTSNGQAAILTTCSGVTNATAENYFRNIKCYTISAAKALGLI